MTQIIPGIAKPLIGMIHLLPLAGSPRYGGNRDAVTAAAVADAQALAAGDVGGSRSGGGGGGVHALMLENYGDAPFFPGPVPAHVIAQMSAIASEVRRAVGLPLGINVLRNDGLAAMSIAAAVGASFIRVNVLCGARLTDQGILQGIAHDLLRLRRTLDAGDVKILADVDVKHSAPLAAMRLEDELADLIERGGADAVIVTGAGTGKATPLEKLERVKAAAGSTPVLIGSGITPASIRDYLPRADGFIVGSALTGDGRAENRVDARRVRELVAALRPEARGDKPSR